MWSHQHTTHPRPAHGAPPRHPPHPTHRLGQHTALAKTCQLPQCLSSKRVLCSYRRKNFGLALPLARAAPSTKVLPRSTCQIPRRYPGSNQGLLIYKAAHYQLSYWLVSRLCTATCCWAYHCSKRLCRPATAVISRGVLAPASHCVKFLRTPVASHHVCPPG